MDLKARDSFKEEAEAFDEEVWAGLKDRQQGR
jgi:hypothetical protein